MIFIFFFTIFGIHALKTATGHGFGGVFWMVLSWAVDDGGMGMGARTGTLSAYRQ